MVIRIDNDSFKHLLSFYSLSGVAIGLGIAVYIQGFCQKKSTQSIGRDKEGDKQLQHSSISVLIETQNLQVSSEPGNNSTVYEERRVRMYSQRIWLLNVEQEFVKYTMLEEGHNPMVL